MEVTPARPAGNDLENSLPEMGTQCQFSSLLCNNIVIVNIVPTHIDRRKIIEPKKNNWKGK